MAKTIGELNISRPKPSLRLDAKDLPELKNWNVGKKYCLRVEVTLESLSKGDEWETASESKKEPLRARFTIDSAEECE